MTHSITQSTHESTRLPLANARDDGHNTVTMKDTGRGVLVFVAGIFLAGALAVAAVAATDVGFLWPTQGIAKTLTSTMCDQRNDHPHAGIDLSLHGKIGTVPIVSVDEGVLMRLRDSQYGYGRAVYVRMPGKNVAVYAHLDRFSPRLKKLGDELRRSTGLKKLDYYYEEWELNVPIARGEILGYGGNTGTSSAHLHFELRYDDLINLNPLTNGFAIADNVAPAIRQIMLAPIEDGGTIAGKGVALVAKVGTRAPFAGPIEVAGPVGIAVDAADRVSPQGRRIVPYRLTVTVDDAPFFETRYEQWSWFDKRLTEVQYEVGAGRKLFLRAFNPYPVEVPFYSSPGGGSFDNLPPGEHTVKVVVADAAGNETSTAFDVRVVDRGGDVEPTWPRGHGAFVLDNRQTIYSADKRLALSAAEFSLFGPLRVGITPIEATDGVGPCYRVAGPDELVRRDFSVAIKIAEGSDPTRQAIYRLKGSGLSWLGNDPDPLGVKASASSFGTFCVAGDTTPPSITKVRARRGRTVVRFRVSDNRAGLAGDGVQVLVGGKKALVGFSPRSGNGDADVYWELPSGPQAGEIVAMDRAGNVARASFTVGGR
jgi:murein DD-endopeptidase MepM/ murein hydrolase activator NlpD